MEVMKTYKFRIYPDADQQAWLARQFGACRFVYNHFLRTRIDYYAEHKDNAEAELRTKKGLTYHDTALMLTQLKKQEGYTWLREANSQALQHALRDLDTAYNNFFNKRAQFPRFKSKRGPQAFHVPQFFQVNGNHLTLPKVGAIRMVVHRPIEGEMRHVTIRKTPAGRFYAMLACQVELSEPPTKQGELGIDVGLKSFLVTSGGEVVEHPKHLLKAEKRMKRLQRSLSRRKKGSSNREKARLTVARQHEKVTNARQDFLHKLSRRLVDENQVIYAEDLNVKGMLANHLLAKRIADSGWGELFRLLDYKGRWYGTGFHQVHRFFPSSKRCHVCGYIHQDLRLSDREWVCPECGTNHNRDKNAALNIEIFGHAERTGGTPGTHTPGESGVARSLNQEASRF
jgi:putative transposase